MRIVRQNTVCFLERFHKFHRELKPGLNFYVPGVDRVSRVISLKETVRPIDHQKVITKDNVEIDLNGFFYYRVTDPYKAHYNVEDFESALTGLSTSVSRSEIGKSTLDQIFQHREQLNERIKDALNESTHAWGVECLNYEILRLDPPAAVKHSLLELAKAERTRRQQVILSEADREFNERVSAASRDAEIIEQQAVWEGIAIWNEEYKKGLEGLGADLADSPHKQRLLRYVLTEEYLKKLRAVLKSKNLCVVPQGGPNDKGSDGLFGLALLLNRLSAGQLEPVAPQPPRPANDPAPESEKGAEEEVRKGVGRYLEQVGLLSKNRTISSVV